MASERPKRAAVPTEKAASSKEAKASSRKKAKKEVDDSERGEHFWLLKMDQKFQKPLFETLAKSPTPLLYSGVRNYEARNSLRAMRPGDKFFHYHCNTKAVGIAGISEVVNGPFADPTATDPTSSWFEGNEEEPPTDKDGRPRWEAIEMAAVRPMRKFISMEELRKHDELAGMALMERPRLSVQPVSRAQWNYILSLEGKK